ncbi:hypothetical protein [Alteribacter natronophilus]|nr:hypothetical protein [Alteribacter natronophilus]
MKTDKEQKFDDGIGEAFRGLIMGLVLMLVVFLVIHFGFGYKAFQ